MKRTFLTTIVIALAMIVNAQTPFEKAMKESLALLDSAKTTEEMQAVAGRFERIAMTETTRWEPLYYAAFTQINMSFGVKDGDKKDAILDVAEKNIEKALGINGDKSELYALQGFLYQGRIQVNPMRGMTYSQKAAEILEKAVEANPENPRALFLMAQNIYYTPKMFGGGGKNALPKFLDAKSKFEKEASKDGIMPKWGAQSNLRMIEACNKDN
jgi:tetratricopeptide (TPR) repeat protein